MKRVIYVAIAILTIVSCTSRKASLPNASGKANQVLILMDDEAWNSPSGDTLNRLFTQDVAGLGWSEPLFDVSRIPAKNFSDILKGARNVLFFDIEPTYTYGQVKYFKNLYANNQAFIKVQAPNISTADSLIKSQGMKMLSFFYTEERERTLINYRKYADTETMKRIKDSVNINILIPTNFARKKFGKDFIWMVSGSEDQKQYFAIYWYPYKDKNTFTVDYLISKRDSVMKANIPGTLEGSYMATSDFLKPEFKAMLVNGVYSAELRGLWETKGDMMGGPFMSQSRVDTVHNRVVTVEGFVYGPNKDKRNALRQLEALAYSWTFANDAK